ncbi:MAG: hypothetical protein AAB491_00140 [Patescibacteria group bacterium]
MKTINFKKIFRYLNYNNYEGIKIKVMRDWKLLLILFVLLLVIISLIDFYIYFDIKEKIDSDVTDAVSIQYKNIEKPSLDDILKMIDARKKQFETIH